MLALEDILKRALRKCRGLAKSALSRLRWLPWELRLRLHGHGPCLKIFTHLTLKEKLLLYKLARELEPASVIVELGSYLGASAACLAAAAKERGSVVYCVDTWMSEAMSEGPRDTYAEFISNTQRYAEQIHPLRGRSLEIAEKFPEPIDLLFLDADHSYAACRSDAEAWLPKVKPGGMVVFHDFGWAEGVQRTVREMVKPIEQSPSHMMENIYWARINRT
jgi:predicted O-methyltransferase YrrM